MCKRKFMVGLLAAMMATSGLAGCGKAATPAEEPAPAPETTVTEPAPAAETPAEEPAPAPEEEKIDLGGRTIKIGAWYDVSPDETTPKGEKLAARKKEMEAKYNCKIEFVNTNNISDNTEMLTTTTLAGDPVFDFGYVDARNIQVLIDKGIVYPLNTLDAMDIENPMWDQLAKKASTAGGNIYGVDNKIDIKYGVYYNKAMFEAAGLPDLYELQRNGEWTWDKLEEFAKKLTIDKDGDGKIDQYGLADTGYDFILQLIYANNGDIINYDGTNATVALGSENVMEALQYYDRVANKAGVTYEYQPDMSWDWQMKAFGENKFAILPHEHYASQAFRDMEDDYGWVMFPKGPKADNYKTVMGTINMQVMSAATKEPEKVAVLMKEWNDYVEGENADSWKEEWYPWFRDANAVDETMVMQKVFENRVFGDYNKFPGAIGKVDEKIFTPLSKGEVTPAAAVEAVTPELEAIIKDTLKK
ncbi:MAG: ABC transporter substrate-binding protein [Cellulosilyticaceae bacterium]